jgi:hypothetical protein
MPVNERARRRRTRLRDTVCTLSTFPVMGSDRRRHSTLQAGLLDLLKCWYKVVGSHNTVPRGRDLVPDYRHSIDTIPTKSGI